MWVVSVGFLLYLCYSTSFLIFSINFALGLILLITTSSLMSDNIEYLYLMSAIVFVVYKMTSNKIFIPVKLVLDSMTYILVSTTIDYNWLFLLPIFLDVLQLTLPFQKRIDFL